VDGVPRDSVPVSDRGLAYGDGLFETIAVHNGKPLRWEGHWRRLEAGCVRLRIPLPDPVVVRAEIDALSAGRSRAVVKLILTRGPGGEGYAPPLQPEPLRIVLRRPWPAFRREALRLRVCRTRLGNNPVLAGIKHLGRLEQVLARSEWGNEYDEGIVLDVNGAVIECTASNLFLWSRDGVLRTPALDGCGVAGVMREAVMETATRLGIAVRVDRFGLEAVETAAGLFITNAVTGPRWVAQVGPWHYPKPSCMEPLCQGLEPAGGVSG